MLRLGAALRRQGRLPARRFHDNPECPPVSGSSLSRAAADHLELACRLGSLPAELPDPRRESPQDLGIPGCRAADAQYAAARGRAAARSLRPPYRPPLRAGRLT